MTDRTEFVYDLETYPNVFTATFLRTSDKAYWQFEVSEFNDELPQLLEFLQWCRSAQVRYVGFNNLGFDYPILHMIMLEGPGGLIAKQMYDKAQAIISAPDNARFAHMVWESDHLIEQVDLYKIHHFDNMARSTSLKVLEFNMGSDNIEDLPIAVGTALTPEQVPILKSYNLHDCRETDKFLDKTRPMIAFREELTERYGKNFLNFNDTKIGKEYFIMRLEEANPGVCKYVDPDTGRKTVRQTRRSSIAIGDLIFPYVGFRHPEFNRILDWLRDCTVTETKGVFKDVGCEVNGFEYTFGQGGIHGSIESTAVKSDDTHTIIDLDVTSYYPSLAIVNRIYPEHLGELFCDIYSQMKQERTQHKKGSPINAMLKLALNGVYGDSNNQYSPFYDPAYLLSITINGQLLLCMLAEMLVDNVPDLEMIQINTDGLTIRIPRDQRQRVEAVKQFWQQLTRLDLEEVEYSRMFIRDVNNYIAEKTDGEIKRKGAYQCRQDLDWHQNFSATIVPLAANAKLLYGVDHREFIRHHKDIHDFMLRVKVRRTDRLVWGKDDQELPRITRYYISTDGGALTKIMPPLRGKTEDRRIGVNIGFLATPCNRMENARWDNINYDFYIAEVDKLVRKFK